jgi:asparagine synthase (glutamine-hydrolysing)
MCGIVGIITNDRDAIPSALAKATAAMIHRGPDDSGTHVFSLGPAAAGFGFRRLAILDLTPAGHQPMVDDATGSSLVFNGEIYNYRTLRRELEGKGVRFRGQSDTEVLLQALVTWGDEAPARLEGMYAFAYHDRTSGRLLIARDPLGIKPLYIARHESTLVFASEIRTILATGLVPADLDPAGVATLLAYGAPQAPFTIHRAISMFPAGSFQWIESESRTAQRPVRFWSFPTVERGSVDPHQAEQTVRRLLDDSVRDHLVSDVPIGVFLSAGIDSTVLAALASRHVGRLRTFTVGFDEPGIRDEVEGAAIAAAAIGSDHEAVMLTGDRMQSYWHQWLAALDHPSIDGFNSFVISRAVREAGLTVALSGLGGDELFGGYGSFRVVERYLRIARRIQCVPRVLRSPLVQVATRFLPAHVREKALDMFCEATSLEEVALQMRRVLSNRQVAALGLPATAVGLPASYVDPSALAEACGESADGDAFAMVSRLEARLYMGNMLLPDTDANSMASSLEIRVPFLGQPVVDYASRLPRAVRSPAGSSPKHLLKQAFGDLIPPPLLERPKTGFTLPIDRWMRGAMREPCAAAIESAAGCGILDPAAVRGLWSRFTAPGSRMLWTRVMPLVSLGACLDAAAYPST